MVQVAVYLGWFITVVFLPFRPAYILVGWKNGGEEGLLLSGRVMSMYLPALSLLSRNTN